MPSRVEIIGLPGVPIVQPGDDLAALAISALVDAAIAPEPGDVLVIAQKIVSKAEDRFVDVAQVTPSEAAKTLAEQTGKDARFCEVVLSESKRIVRHRENLIIAEHRRGWVMANAGIDHSNVAPGDGHDRVLLLPIDPDASARAIREELVASYRVPIAVIISDSFGRPFRRGTVGIALGTAGLPSVIDWRGHPDLFGRALEVTETGFADEIAAAASLVMGQADEALPMVLVRGLHWTAPEADGAALVRPPEHDLFR
ncbi:MAG TPA: coenzyme F420-0:L-glutamate ligase [Stellaceae bacterium]|jgi:coenzyme F420-0:L-glutamate ligase/coenzyme F420-1:gamma-L-glutamate ligase|nr:coenzyme F420-0:L-glutamate ligase [Stellaceae bacterium]